jgi:hypothetical protein
MIFGAVVFGVVGAAVGYYMNTAGSIWVAGVVGIVLGIFIGVLGGRRFFISIVCGALLGAGLFGFVSGVDAVPLGAGVGGAVGGFVGVQLGMLMDLWQQHKESTSSEAPPSGNSHPR